MRIKRGYWVSATIVYFWVVCACPGCAWCDLPRVSLPCVADSSYIVLSGQHVSRALRELVAEMRVQHVPVPRSMQVVQAKMLARSGFARPGSHAMDGIVPPTGQGV